MSARATPGRSDSGALGRLERPALHPAAGTLGRDASTADRNAPRAKRQQNRLLGDGFVRPALFVTPDVPSAGEATDKSGLIDHRQPVRMPARETAIQLGARRSRYLLRRAGEELRVARMSIGMSARTLGRSVGISHSEVLRIERALAPHARIETLAQDGLGPRLRAESRHPRHRSSDPRQGTCRASGSLRRKTQSTASVAYGGIRPAARRSAECRRDDRRGRLRRHRRGRDQARRHPGRRAAPSRETTATSARSGPSCSSPTRGTIAR